MPAPKTITPFLWFDDQGEQAAQLYVSIFPNSKITHISRYGEAGKERHRREPGTAMTVAFELDGQPFTALNGGPQYKFTEAISFQISCDTQDEIDHYWSQLSAGGDPNAQRCGWLKDRFGISWQIVPSMLGQLLGGADPGRCGRAMNAFMKMKKLDIAALEHA